MQPAQTPSSDTEPASGSSEVPAVAAPASASEERRGFPLRAAVAYPAAALSGLLYFLAFPGMEVWPLAFVALVPLILALRQQTPRRALLLGWLAGLVMTMLGFYWLIEMLEVFSGFPLPLCVLFMTLLWCLPSGSDRPFGVALRARRAARLA